MPAPEALYEKLSQLLLTDPREARRVLLNVIDSDADAGDALLRDISKPGYSRLKSLVANVARHHPQKPRFIPFLLDWRDSETDEFTRRAITAALADVDERSYAASVVSKRALPTQIVELHQYVSDRMKHRIRNSMLAAQTFAAQLRELIPAESSEEVLVAVAKLNDAMATIGRVVEATDGDPAFFENRPIPIVDWLKQLNAQYASKYAAIHFTIEAEPKTLSVNGSDYLLETIFWNIWTNAHQAIGPDCHITIRIRKVNDQVTLVILDNGDGFSEELIETAFSQAYSTNSPGRGRGLLEVSEAVGRLHGSVELFPYFPNNYRIRLSLPDATRY